MCYFELTSIARCGLQTDKQSGTQSLLSCSAICPVWAATGCNERRPSAVVSGKEERYSTTFKSSDLDVWVDVGALSLFESRHRGSEVG